MGAEIIADGRFLDPESVLRFQASGATVNVKSILSDLPRDLPEPAYGEAILGVLVPAEAVLFVSLSKAHEELQRESKNVLAEIMTKAGSYIRDADVFESPDSIVSNLSASSAVSDETKESMFRLKQRHAMLHSAFYFHLGERFGRHRYRLGIRSQGRVVSIEEK